MGPLLLVSMELYYKCMTFDMVSLTPGETNDDIQSHALKTSFDILDFHPLLKLTSKQPQLTRRSKFYSLKQPSLKLDLAPVRVQEEDSSPAASSFHHESNQSKLNKFF